MERNELKQKAQNLPETPGVYLMYNRDGGILYVGKAVNLKRRVSQYFQKRNDRNRRIEQMIASIDHFDTIHVETELEALFLESNLIKKHRPRYNSQQRKDQNHPYLKITDEEFPRLVVTTENEWDNSRYFGPYGQESKLEEIAEQISKFYRLRTCAKLPKNGRPCLRYSMNLCSAPCRGKLLPDQYQKQTESAIDFIQGRNSDHISDEVEEFLDYHTRGHQETADLFAIAGNEQASVVVIFFIRNGKMTGRDMIVLPPTSSAEELPQTLTTFVKRFYGGAPYQPETVILPGNERYTVLLELAAEGAELLLEQNV